MIYIPSIEMQKDIRQSSNLSLGGEILEDVSLFFYTFLSKFSIVTF